MREVSGKLASKVDGKVRLVCYVERFGPERQGKGNASGQKTSSLRNVGVSSHVYLGLQGAETSPFLSVQHPGSIQLHLELHSTTVEGPLNFPTRFQMSRLKYPRILHPPNGLGIQALPNLFKLFRVFFYYLKSSPPSYLLCFHSSQHALCQTMRTY